jgi:hypothetical protein
MFPALARDGPRYAGFTRKTVDAETDGAFHLRILSSLSLERGYFLNRGITDCILDPLSAASKVIYKLPLYTAHQIVTE